MKATRLWTVMALLFLLLVAGARRDGIIDRLLVGLPLYLLGAHWMVAFLSRGEISGALPPSASPSLRACMFVAGVVLVASVVPYVWGLGFFGLPRDLA
jgi:hypothetical protein